MRILLPGILLIYTSITDIKERTISGVALILFTVAGLICLCLGRNLNPVDSICGALIGLSLALVSFCTNGELGMGDALLLLVTGIFLGFERNLTLLLLALMLSSLFSVYLLIREKNVKKEYPFVPFLFISYVMMFIFKLE